MRAIAQPTGLSFGRRRAGLAFGLRTRLPAAFPKPFPEVVEAGTRLMATQIDYGNAQEYSPLNMPEESRRSEFSTYSLDSGLALRNHDFVPGALVAIDVFVDPDCQPWALTVPLWLLHGPDIHP